MANPTSNKNTDSMDFGDQELRCGQISVSGNVVTAAQQSTIADAAAPTAYSAHSSGGTAVTSTAATDLDTTAAALATLVTEMTTLTTKVNSILTALETAGIVADA
jgi:hypothetical protein